MEIKEKMQNRLDNIVGKNNIFGAVLKVERGNGEMIFEGAAGNITLTNQYFIASTTKIYTTAMIMKLRSENYLNLEDKITNFFDKNELDGIASYKGKNYLDQITVKDLLAHTSGLPSYFADKDETGSSSEGRLMKNIDEDWPFNKVLAFAKKNELKFIPVTKGKAYYSDTNFQLLGAIVEKAIGKVLAEIFEAEIFKPLSLENTYAFRPNVNSNLVGMYYKDSQISIPKAMASFDSDGGIVSNVSESMIFLKSFMQGKLFPVEYLKDMSSEFNRIFFPLQYGVGIMKFELPAFFTLFKKLPVLIGHSGISGAFEYYAPDLDIYFTGTVNQIANPSLSYNKLLVPALIDCMKL